MGVRVEAFFEEGGEVDEVCGCAEVFLGELDFQHQGGIGHGPEQGVEGFAGLEVDGAVLYLYQYVAMEAAVEGLEFGIGLPGPVFGGLVTIYEGPPDDDPLVWSEGVGEHIGAVGVGTAVVLRTGLAFGVGLD